MQLSSVQTLPSLQFGAGPPTHTPPAQVSPVVHASPSLQGAVLFVWTQPLPTLQLSSVHGLASSQLGPGPDWQVPLTQTSPTVHAFPSLHEAELLVWTQPVAGLQVSSVQPLPSSQ